MQTSSPAETRPTGRRATSTLVAFVTAALVFAACGTSEGGAEPADTNTAEPTAEVPDEAADANRSGDDASDVDDADHDHGDDADHDHDDVSDSDHGAVDVSLFFDGALTQEVTTEDCTLSGGAETTCYRITVAGDPVTYDTGPFCPTSIDDTAEAGGVWFDGNGVYDLDGDFIAGLAELYDDDNWLMYDEQGNVLVTETAEEFDLAARPDVDPSLQNHCVEGRLEWLANGEPVTTTVLIPVEPVLADTADAGGGNLGVTLDGVVIAQSAPVDAILSAYTIAAFDDCGGHYNPVDGYHLHGALGCSELDEVADGETPMFAYAMDGFPVLSPLSDATGIDLDECGGHTTDELGYHYHANSAEQNLVITCLIGQVVATADGAAGGRPAGPPPGAGD